MANASTAKTTTLPPASSASVSAKPIAPKKSGFDPMRPVRHLIGFAGGTYTGTLDGMANWGRKGSRVGLALGILSMITLGGGAAAIAIGWAAGLVCGAVTGGAVGLATGGIRASDRESRKDKYAEDLMLKSRAASQAKPSVDYRDAHREYSRRSDRMLDRILRQDRENDEQARSSSGGRWM
jgi:hypothetical protein